MVPSDDNNIIPVWAQERIEIKRPDPKWCREGIQKIEELLQLLFPFGVNEIEHIGSTAIPNLPAKPIIDLMAAVPTFHQLDEIVGILAPHDWHYVPPELDKQNWRRFFVKVKNDKRIAHLHLMKVGEERWEMQLLFRNKLRTNPYLVHEYSNLKRKLAKEYSHDREGYTQAKTDFINRVLYNYYENTYPLDLKKGNT